ncbi:hypothetical protein OHB00_02850 [Streptomyces sp. NBC_00631]|uniref:hypothetical protein n=1 Tax=Streptomyces sp. NBC_00631 TaxID=2975793 RepID=UPI0030DFDA47
MRADYTDPATGLRTDELNFPLRIQARGVGEATSVPKRTNGHMPPVERAAT